MSRTKPVIETLARELKNVLQSSESLSFPHETWTALNELSQFIRTYTRSEASVADAVFEDPMRDMSEWDDARNNTAQTMAYDDKFLIVFYHNRKQYVYRYAYSDQPTARHIARTLENNFRGLADLATNFYECHAAIRKLRFAKYESGLVPGSYHVFRAASYRGD